MSLKRHAGRRQRHGANGWRHRRIGGAAGVLALLLAAGSASGAAPTTPSPANATSAVQSVSIAMGSDGTTTGIEATTIFTLPAGRGSTAPATSTATESFSPQEVINDLPVRVLTSWTAAGSSGTDLSELAGRSGLLEIELTVQNLTGRAMQLEYDAAGAARTQMVQLAVPLTVAASARLAGVSADQIVVASPQRVEPAVTNGVVAQSGADGATAVQWATILAPPQLPASDTIRLVVNAADFVVPDFDIAVVPGVHTDVSASGLLSGTLVGAESSDTEQLARTLQLIADVTTVLARASATITQVSTNLTAAGETLGAQAVADLQQSAASLSAQMQALADQADALGSELSSSLTSTRSTLLLALQQTVQAAAGALGDTSAAPPAPEAAGTGCDTVVSGAAAQPSVYGALALVAAQLGAYADAGQDCKERIRASLIELVGPAAPDAASCAASASLSCTALAARLSFEGIADSLRRARTDALAALSPSVISDLDTTFAAVSAQVDAAAATAQQLAASGDADNQTIADLAAALVAARAESARLSRAILDVHVDAQTALDDNAAMTQTGADLSSQICGLIADGTLTGERGEALLSYLTEDSAALASCLAPGGTPGPAGPTGFTVTPNAGDGLAEQLSRQAAALTAILEQTAASAADASTAELLVGLNADLDALDIVLDALGDVDFSGAWRLSVAPQLTTLSDVIVALIDRRDAAGLLVDQIVAQQASLREAALDALADAADAADEQARFTAAQQLTMLQAQLAGALTGVDASFDQSTQSLSSAARDIAADGAALVAAQQLVIEDAARDAGLRISEQVSVGLAGVASSIASSTSDLASASALLTMELQAVLLDLGDQEERTGLLGSIATSSATAGAADSQLSVATGTATTYANARTVDLNAVQLRAAQARAALQANADLPLFHVDLPVGVDHRAVYAFHIGTSR